MHVRQNGKWYSYQLLINGIALLFVSRQSVLAFGDGTRHTISLCLLCECWALFFFSYTNKQLAHTLAVHWNCQNKEEWSGFNCIYRDMPNAWYWLVHANRFMFIFLCSFSLVPRFFLRCLLFQLLFSSLTVRKWSCAKTNVQNHTQLITNDWIRIHDHFISIHFIHDMDEKWWSKWIYCPNIYMFIFAWLA